MARERKVRIANTNGGDSTVFTVSRFIEVMNMCHRHRKHYDPVFYRKLVVAIGFIQRARKAEVIAEYKGKTLEAMYANRIALSGEFFDRLVKTIERFPEETRNSDNKSAK